MLVSASASSCLLPFCLGQDSLHLPLITIPRIVAQEYFYLKSDIYGFSVLGPDIFGRPLFSLQQSSGLVGEGEESIARVSPSLFVQPPTFAGPQGSHHPVVQIISWLCALCP